MKGDLLQPGVQQRLAAKLKRKIFKRQRKAELPTGGNHILWVAQYREAVRREQKGLRAALTWLKQNLHIYIYLSLVEHSKANSTGIWTLFNSLHCVLPTVIGQRSRPTLLTLQTISEMLIMAEASKHIPCTPQKGEEKQSRHSSEARNNSDSSRAPGLCRGWARYEAWLQGNPTVSAQQLPWLNLSETKNFR